MSHETVPVRPSVTELGNLRLKPISDGGTLRSQSANQTNATIRPTPARAIQGAPPKSKIAGESSAANSARRGWMIIVG